MRQMCRNMKQNSVVFSESILFFALAVCLRPFAVVCVPNTQIQRSWKVRIMTGLKQTQRRFTKRGLRALFIYHVCLFFLINSLFPTWSRRLPRNLDYLIILGTVYPAKNEFTKSVYSGLADARKICISWWIETLICLTAQHTSVACIYEILMLTDKYWIQ